MSDENEVQEGPEINRTNLDSLGAVATLGAWAAAFLKECGKAVFVLNPEGEVTWANPVLVDVPIDSVKDLSDRPYRFVRPILTDGRPQFVALRDGRLWEIEFIDEAKENSGSKDH